MSNYSYFSRKQENYGSVTFSNSSFRRRRATVTEKQEKPTESTLVTDDDSICGQSDSPSDNPYSKQNPFENRRTDIRNRIRSREILVYKYNTSTGTLLIPSLLFIYSNHHSPISLIVTLQSLLILYGLDLCGAREGVASGIWLAFGAVMITFLWEHYRWNLDDPWGSAGLFFNVLILFCAGCWGTLQMKWLYIGALDYGKGMEAFLHTILPIASAAVITHFFANVTGIVAASPYIFAFVVYYAIVKLGKTPSSYVRPSGHERKKCDSRYARSTQDEESKFVKKTSRAAKVEYSISEWSGNLLLVSLLSFPALVHFWQCWASLNLSISALLEVLSIVSISYSACWLLNYNEVIWWHEGGRRRKGQNLKVLIAIAIALASFQYCYLSPRIILIYVDIYGGKTISYLKISMYLNGGILGLIGTTWLYQKRDLDGEPYFGKNHEDLCAFAALVSLIFLGSSLPFSFDVALLAALSILSLVVTVVSKSHTSMAASTICCGTCMTLLHYHRFLFMNQNVWLIPGYYKVSFLKFSMLPILLGTLVIFMYIAVRMKQKRNPKGRHSVALNLLPGLMLLAYTLLLVIVEASMHEGVAGVTTESRQPISAYSKSMVMASSMVLTLVSFWLKHITAIGGFSAIVVSSVALGKTIAILISEVSNELQNGHASLLFTSLMCGVFGAIMSAPYFLLSPLHIPAASAKRSSLMKSKLSKISFQTNALLVYCTFILPFTLALVVPGIFLPAVTMLFKERCVYNIYPHFAELFGFSILFWGFSVLSMIQYLFPGGECRSWRKFASTVSLLGALLLFSRPIAPFLQEGAQKNLFHTVSSATTSNINEQADGAWGLVSSVLLAYMFFTRQLKRGSKHGSKHIQGSIEKHDIKRNFILSALFGSGFGWYLTSLFAESYSSWMSSLLFASTAFVATSLTLSSLLVYTSTDKELGKVIGHVRTSIIVTLLPVAVISTFERLMNIGMEGSRLPGCSSIILFTHSLFIYILTMALRSRKSKEPKIRRLTNICVALSWIAIIVAIHAFFGLASVGVQSTFGFAMGVPMSVVLTIAVAPILINLDNESKESNATKKRASIFPTLRKSTDNYHLCVFGTISFFLLITLYAIFVRGITGQVYLYTDFAKVENLDSLSSLSSLAKRYATRKEETAIASKLAACGFWTSQFWTAPLKHLAGLVVGPLVTWIVSFPLLFETKVLVPSRFHAIGILLNSTTIFVCKGIPSLSAAAYLSIVVCVRNFHVSRRKKWKHKMSI